MTDLETNMVEVIKAADYAARQSDRWLFIASLVIGILFTTFVVKRLLTYINTLNEQSRSDSHEYAQALAGFINKSNELIPQWTAHLAQNTKALEANTELIRRFSETLEQKRRSSDHDERRTL